jgi:hypothetical protein
VAATVVACVACQPRTELILGVATDLHAQDDIDEVDLQIVRADTGAQVGSQQFMLSAQSGVKDNLPGSFGVFSDGEDTPLDITLTAVKGGSNVVTRHAIMSLVGGETLFYRLGLTAACATVTDCGSDEDCVEGSCTEKFVNAHQFPGFDDTLVSTLTCTSGTVYVDTSMNNAAMPTSADAADCGSGLCHEGTCLNPPPSCSTGNAIAACQPALAACNSGCGGNCTFDGGDCSAINQLDLNSECLAALCALFACATSADADWGSGSDGQCEPQGCLEENSSQATAACSGGTGSAAAAVRRLIGRVGAQTRGGVDPR